ncbi:MAG: 5-formyltetrahydrofolate cyclo-ligase [Coriobacteriia bacterium]|nr:5-formyltetrahydrofolate cyclo-ligase [Coriobacteriia bacterium]MCL2745908.1 5-formyltetrahydrofolate cyclo-ligase [Coriobacteriia bacterium]MCL2870826.1 5-formyltetrahydrofolate cyclo-ligase [Coriobacteriia bacterium]
MSITGQSFKQKGKEGLRAQALAVRKELLQKDDFVLRSSSLIAGNFLSIPEVQNALRIALEQGQTNHQQCFASYAPSKGEPNPNGFLDTIESSGGVRPRMTFPRIAGKGKLSLHFALLEHLLPGSFGIPEPGADMPLVDLKDIAVMLVPGLAFDAQGNRLGYGKGYYDQLLAPLQQGLVPQLLSQQSDEAPEGLSVSKGPLLVGISYDETLFDQLPAEPHDVKMDYIVTPQQTIAC